MDITQIPDYVEMSCKTYITRFLKSHGWYTAAKLILDETIATDVSAASLSIQEINCVQIENCTTSI